MLATRNLQIGAADTGGSDLNYEFALARSRGVFLDNLQASVALILVCQHVSSTSIDMAHAEKCVHLQHYAEMKGSELIGMWN